MKSYLVLVQKFSNYKNRKLVLPDIDREEPLTALQDAGYTYDYCRGATGTSAIIDFNPNDGISTSVIINWENTYEPDYLMVLDSDDSSLVSRWFIIEFKRTRGKQYQVQLQRDVLADYYGSIKNSPLFVQKGILNSDNPLIFNRENMSYNQIKQSELLLKDNTNSAWIVGYVAHNASGFEKEISAQPQNLSYPDISSLVIFKNASDPTEGAYVRQLSGYINFRTKFKPSVIHILNRAVAGGFDQDFTEAISEGVYEVTGSSYGFEYGYGTSYSRLDSAYPKAMNVYKTILKSDFANYLSKQNYSLITNSDFSKLLSYVGQIVRVGTHYYRLNLTAGTTYEKTIDVETSGDTAALSSDMDGIIRVLSQYDDGVVYNKSGNPHAIWWSEQEYVISLTEASLPYTLKVTLTAERRHTEDAPYDIFAMEYNESNLRLAQEMVRDETTSNIYDVQVLPYIPQNNLLNSNGVIDITLPGITEGVDYNNIIAASMNKYSSNTFNSWETSQGSQEHTLCQESYAIAESQLNETFIAGYSINDEEGVVEDLSVVYNSSTNTIRVAFEVADDVSQEVIDHIAVHVSYGWVVENAVAGQLIWCTRSNRSFSIAANIAPASNKKVANETEFVRLVSPNWNGAYEFSVAKNEGVQSFNVDCTFKPYTPYIHVAPQFGGIYGTVQDARGLICNGDFSITMVNDVWNQYEINNKNYQQIFNAQIHTMDKNNQLSLGSNVASSMMSAAAFGVGAGVMTGNPLVGIGAGVASAAGGIADIAIGQQQYQNNRQLQIDQYGYQLGNIQARPDTLNKVSTLTANNRIWPFVEFYKASDEEIEALKNKIKYNGMTIMAIGTMSEYIGREYEGVNYFQASVIMNEDIACDNHTLEQIDLELQKGVYL